MSSYPLPALDIRPQQQESPLDAYAKVLQMKGLMAQQQMIPGQIQEQQQRLQQGQMQNQMTQMDVQARQLFGQALQQSGGDYEKAFGIAEKNGANPVSLMPLKGQIVEYKQKLLGYTKEQQDFARSQSDLIQGAYDKVNQAAPPDKAQVYAQQIAQLKQVGVQGTEQMPAQYPGDEAFAQVGTSLRAHSQLQEDAFKQAETQKNVSQGFEAQQRGEQLQRGGTPEMQKARYVGILAKIKAGKPLLDDDLSFAQAYEAGEAKTTTQSDTLGITSTNTSKPSGLASVAGKSGGGAAGAGSAQPSAKDSIVDMVGQYKLNPMMLQRMIIKHPEVIAAVGQKYPDFDQTNYQAKAKAMESFTSGPYSRQINATNIALDHLGVLGDAVDGLKNNDIKVLNRIANSVGLQTGNSAVTVFNTIAHKLAPELAQAYIQGGGGEGERSQIQKDYDASLGPDQLKNNLAITARLLQPNIETIQQQYKNTIGRDDFQQRFLTPGAQKSMQRFSPQQGGGGMIRARDPQGKLHEAPTGTPLPQGWTKE